MWTDYIFLAVTVAALFATLYSAISDWRILKIPNIACLVVLLAYPLAVLTAPMEIAWLWALAIAGAIFIIGFGLFAVGALGGGDVKLITALTLWSGVDMTLLFIVATVFAGGLVVVAAIIRDIRRNHNDKSITRGVRAALRAKLKVPYGVAIAIGGFPVFFSYLNQLNFFS
jgi:prepilin peptidase CpaA